MEDGHYKARCEELKAQVESQKRIISDYQAELHRKDQVHFKITEGLQKSNFFYFRRSRN